MFRNRIILTILTLTMFSAVAFGQQAANSGPSLGKWAFTGKDNTGVDWKGTLTLSKIDPNQFSGESYHALCSVEVESSATSKSVEAPGTYDPAARAIAFSTGVETDISYTAVLSPDGKTLKGKWTETTKPNRRTGQTAKLVQSGEWTATFGAK